MWLKPPYTGCWQGTAGEKSSHDANIPRTVNQSRRTSKKLEKEVAEERQRQAKFGRPVRLMFQDEARFGRIKPVEHLWDEIREKCFPNGLFKSLDQVEDRLVEAPATLEISSFRVASITGFHWIIRLILMAY